MKNIICELEDHGEFLLAKRIRNVVAGNGDNTVYLRFKDSVLKYQTPDYLDTSKFPGSMLEIDKKRWMDDPDYEESILSIIDKLSNAIYKEADKISKKWMGDMDKAAKAIEKL